MALVEVKTDACSESVEGRQGSTSRELLPVEARADLLVSAAALSLEIILHQPFFWVLTGGLVTLRLACPVMCHH